MNLNDVYQVLQQTHDYEDIFFIQAFLWNPKLFQLATDGELTIEDIQFCYESVRRSQECGYSTSMIWSKEPFSFQTINDVTSLLKNIHSNRTTLPLFLSQEQYIDETKSLYDFDEDQPKLIPLHTASTMTSQQMDTFFANITEDTMKTYFEHIYICDEMDDYYHNIDVIKELRFQLMKFGQYYIFMMIEDC